MDFRRVGFASAGLGWCVLLTAAMASAEPTAADRETARSFMQEGRELRDKGDLQGALKRFQAADAIMHVPTTGFEVARTQVALGLLVEARDTIAAIRKTPAKPSDPEPFTEARAKAEDLDGSLEGRVPSLTIAVEGVPEGQTPTVTIDGVQVPAAAVSLPRKVDPGHHVIVAKAAAAEGTQEIEIHEKEQKQVQVTLSAASVPPSSGGEPPANPEATPEEQTTSHSPSWITWAGVGLAGVGVVAGSITGILELSKASALSDECSKVAVNGKKACANPQSQSDLSTAQTLATISTVSFIAAGVGAAVALGSLVVGHPVPAAANAPPPSAARSDARRARGAQWIVTPWIGLGAAGLRGSF
jgi:hypothetical protein